MKAFIHLSLGALVIACVAPPLSSAVAQTIEATQTTTTAQGTVSEFGPQSIIIKTEAGSTPVRYISRDTTNYVDENGNPLTAASVVPGHPVTVYYTKVGDTMIASKVMVHGMTAGSVPATRTTETTRVQSIDPTQPIATTPSAAVQTTQTTTTSEGTVSEVGPGQILIRSTTSPTPLRYRFAPTTTYVDETGAHISLEMVKSGLPVTVLATPVGDGFVASKVIVRTMPVTRTAVTGIAPGPIVEKERVITREPPPVIIKERVREPEPERVIVKKHVPEPEPEHVRIKKHVVEDEPVLVKKHIAPPEEVIIKKTTTTTTTTTPPER